MRTPFLFPLVLVSACATGSSSRQVVESTPPAMTPEENVVQQERVDEIMRLCNRKAGIAVPRCWDDEYMRTKQKFEAQVTLMVVVTEQGKAKEVKVVASQAASKPLQDCLMDEARSWSYPEGKGEAHVNCSFFLRSSM